MASIAWRASALQLMLKVQARVRREGRDRRIAADELVPGDIVILESGNTVPAVRSSCGG